MSPNYNCPWNGQVSSNNYKYPKEKVFYGKCFRKTVLRYYLDCKVQKMWSKSTFRVRYLQSSLFDLEMINLPVRESVKVQVRVGVPVYTGTQVHSSRVGVWKHPVHASCWQQWKQTPSMHLLDLKSCFCCCFLSPDCICFVLPSFLVKLLWLRGTPLTLSR